MHGTTRKPRVPQKNTGETGNGRRGRHRRWYRGRSIASATRGITIQAPKQVVGGGDSRDETSDCSRCGQYRYGPRRTFRLCTTGATSALPASTAAVRSLTRVAAAQHLLQTLHSTTGGRGSPVQLLYIGREGGVSRLPASYLGCPCPPLPILATNSFVDRGGQPFSCPHPSTEKKNKATETTNSAAIISYEPA